MRHFLLPLLGLALFTAETASAQTLPPTAATKRQARQEVRAERRTGRTLTAREKRAAAAAAKVTEAEAAQTTLAAAAPAPASAWSGWSNEALPQSTDIGNGQHRPTTNVSVAPGMPLNQVGHGVSTDYHGRPIYRTTAANTTLAPGR